MRRNDRPVADSDRLPAVEPIGRSPCPLRRAVEEGTRGDRRADPSASAGSADDIAPALFFASDAVSWVDGADLRGQRRRDGPTFGGGVGRRSGRRGPAVTLPPPVPSNECDTHCREGRKVEPWPMSRCTITRGLVPRWPPSTPKRRSARWSSPRRQLPITPASLWRWAALRPQSSLAGRSSTRPCAGSPCRPPG